MVQTDLEFGVVIWTLGPPKYTQPEDFRQVATTAEDLGFDHIVAGDHVTFPSKIPDSYSSSRSGDSPFDSQQNIFDVFSVFSHLTALTDEVTVQPDICVAPLRHPVTLTKLALSLNAIADGRFEFGVGAGWLSTEYDVLDVPFDERGSRTDEFLDIFKRACEEGLLTYDGPHHSFQETGFFPSPDETPPLWIGGNSGATFRRTAEFADGWTCSGGTPDDVAEGVARLAPAWDDYGRKGTPNIQVKRRIDIGSDTRRDPAAPLVGEPEEVAAGIERYAESGTDRLIVNFYTPDIDEQVGQLKRFADDVLPTV